MVHFDFYALMSFAPRQACGGRRALEADDSVVVVFLV